MVEIWKDIVGYEGLYQVSNMGRVKSLNYNHTLEERILKNIKSNGYYYRVMLYKNKKGKSIRIHRLVGNAFIKNPDNKPCINHIDGNKSNNRVDNLEWCTYKENTEHAFITGMMVNRDTKGIKNCKSKLNNVQVLEIREKYSTGKYTYQELADEYNVHKSTIELIINRKLWKHI